MLFAEVSEGALVRYPVREHELRAENPQTTFPADLAGVDLADWGLVPVAANPPPGNLQPGQVAEEADPQPDEQGVWTQNWTVRAGTSDELLAAKAARLAALDARRGVAIAAGASVPGLGSVKTTEESIENITQAVVGAVLAAVTSQPYSIGFPLLDGTRPTLNATQMMAIGKVVGERKNACHARAATLAAAITAAADFAALAAIDIETGWPS